MKREQSQSSAMPEVSSAIPEFNSAALVADVKAAPRRLRAQYQSGLWGELARSLDSLSKMARAEGQLSLAGQAQSLAEVLGYRGGGRSAEPGHRVTELLEQLIAELGQWGWTLEHEQQSSQLASNLTKSTLTH